MRVFGKVLASALAFLSALGVVVVLHYAITSDIRYVSASGVFVTAVVVMLTVLVVASLTKVE